MSERRHNSFVRLSPVLIMAVAIFLLSSAARAATVAGFSDLMSRGQANRDADHQIKFVTPSGVGSPTDTITLNFQPDFDLSAISFSDIDLAVDNDGTPGDCSGAFGDAKSLAAAASVTDWGATVGGQTLTLTPPTGAGPGEIPAGSCVRLLIGQNAAGGGSNSQITNPSSSGSYNITLAGGFGDSGTASVAISNDDQIMVTARVAGGGGGGCTSNCGGGCTATHIINIRTLNGDETSIDVLWDTDIASSSTVDYGPTISYGSSTSVGGDTFNHNVHLSGLTPGTLYHYRVRSTVPCGEETASGDNTFNTGDTTAPVMSNIGCQNVTGTSFTVVWDTDEDADSRVDYGFSEPYANFVFDPSMVNSHSMDLTGLTPNSLYRYRTTSKDGSGNSSTSAEFTCQTLDSIPPVISNVRCDNATNSSFRVNWSTDELADSRVDYGLTTTYTDVASNPSFVANHQITLTALQPATTYHYKATSQDAAGNLARSGDFTCATIGDTTPPGNVQDFTAQACDQTVTLNWSNPNDGDFSGTKIQRSTGSNPPNPNSGTTIYNSNGTSHVDSGLPNGVTQYYTAFAYDTSGNYASGALQHATPTSAHSPFCPAPPVVCGNNMCETGENHQNCAVDCPVPPVCYSCQRATYDVYLINPDHSERHMNTPWVQVEDRGNGVYRLHFEDATLDPQDSNYDHNDAVVDVDTKDCSSLKFTFISSEAGWDHQIRIKVFIDGVERSDNLLTSSTKNDLGTTKTYNAGQGLDAPMCPVPGQPPVCGNNFCEAGENHGQCPADCPAPPTHVCGNALCEQTENPQNCPADCHVTPPVCGNGVCESGENAGQCPVDCSTKPPPTSNQNLNPEAVHYYAMTRSLPLHKDGNGVYHDLPDRSFSVQIRESDLPKAVTSIVLNFDGGSYFFAKNGATGEYWSDVTAPTRLGLVNGSIVINYADGTQQRIAFRLQVDPPGLIYEMLNGQRTAVPGASVTLQKFVGTWTTWDATPYHQVNPVNSDAQGHYGFMVPPGQYQIVVDKNGYREAITPPFTIATEVVNKDIEVIRIPPEFIIPGATLTENLGNVARGLAAQGQYITRIVQKEIIENPGVKNAVTNIIVPIAAIITAMALATAVQAASLLSYLYFLFTQPFLLLARRKRKEFGTVYNALTKRPVDLAIVRLIRSTTGKLVRTLVTDKQGRYAFLVDPGEYRIEVSKQGFIFPTQYLKDRKEDAQFLDLYHGEIIKVGEKGAIITANIPMDPLDIAKSAKRLVWEDVLRRLQGFLAILSVLLTLLAALLYRLTYLYILLAVQIIVYLIFRRLARPGHPKNWGIIYDARTKKPVPFAVARIVETQYNKVLESRVTDSKGRYNFLVGNNKYVVTVEKPGYEGTKTAEIDLTKVGKEGGVVSTDIAIKESSKKT